MLKQAALSAIAAGWVLPEGHINRYLELVHLRKLLTALNINCILDVGANEGQFGSEMRGIGYRGKIVSFEPVARSYSKLKENIGSDPHWSCRKMALGSRNGTANINVFPKLTVLSSLLAPMKSQPDIETEQIEVRRLDDVLPEVIGALSAPRIYLKIDTQGYDLEVFRGAEGCLPAIQGLQSEIAIQLYYHNSPHYLESLSAYEQAGFELFDLTVVARRPDSALLEMNCLMRRRAQ